MRKNKFYDQSNEPVIIFIFNSLRIIQLGDMTALAKTAKKECFTNQDVKL